MSYALVRRLDWRRWVVPEPLRSRPIHRWFVFPHSFTDDVVRALVSEWELGPQDRVIDTFAGAGTTILACKEVGLPAIGFDLSPLAVLACRAKVADYDVDELRRCSRELLSQLQIAAAKSFEATPSYPELVTKALPGKKLAVFHHAKASIADLGAPAQVRDFLTLALLAQIPKFSNAVPTGGWLSWRENARPAEHLPDDLACSIEAMIADLVSHWPDGIDCREHGAAWMAQEADARQLPVGDGTCSAVITSPPYPNRHDYTRVFGVELMFGFLDWGQTRKLRYQTIHSHPEAKPARPVAVGYEEPRAVSEAIDRVAESETDPRVVAMLHGYFLDLFLSLSETQRVIRNGGRAALVLGNAQYRGIPIEVDVAAAEIGEQAGLTCTEVRVVRERGNSAQQMATYGRIRSRESIVMFEKR